MLFTKSYWKLGKMNARIWKKIWNKGEITLDSLRQQLFAFKEFCMEMRLSNIFKTKNITNLIKVILESSYRVLQVTFK